MNNLAFLKGRMIPTLRKLAGTSKYGFDEDDELIESALHELNQAIESKDHNKLIDSIKAIVACLMNKHSEESNETHA